jgi:hypothetical protein
VYAYEGFAQKSQAIATNEKVVRQYYAAYEKKDWPMLEMLFADGFNFTSPAGDDHINVKVYKERCWPNSTNAKKFEFEKILIDGDVAIAVYNGYTNNGKVFRNAERFKIKNGKNRGGGMLFRNWY